MIFSWNFSSSFFVTIEMPTCLNKLPRSLPPKISTARPILYGSTRLFTSSHGLLKDSVPVATYSEKGQTSTKHAQRSTLHVDKAQRQPPPTDAKDVTRNAVPFDRNILSKMTPTMKSFTLDGKVAVVTGWVSKFFVQSICPSLSCCHSPSFSFSLKERLICLFCPMAD